VKQEIERDRTTAAGLRAVVLMTSMGFRCGYVGVPAGHFLHGHSYSAPHPLLADLPDDEPVGKRGVIALMAAAFDQSRTATPEIYFNVHGGITYSNGKPDYPANSDGLWWFGYDCGHAGDCASPEYFVQERERWPNSPIFWEPTPGDVHRSLEYCVDECESLASQIQKVQVEA